MTEHNPPHPEPDRQPPPSDGGLLPCPHCGKSGGMMQAGGVYQAFCSDSQCLSIQTYATKAEAIAAWNTRANPPTPEGGDIDNVKSACTVKTKSTDEGD